MITINKHGGVCFMIIGVPKEIKANENRVAITPAGVEAFVKAGHKVFIEKRQDWAAALPMRSIWRPGLLCWTHQKRYTKRLT